MSVETLAFRATFDDDASAGIARVGEVSRRSALAIESAQLKVEKATSAVGAAQRRYGENSLQARTATNQLAQAELRLADANLRAQASARSASAGLITSGRAAATAGEATEHASRRFGLLRAAADTAAAGAGFAIVEFAHKSIDAYKEAQESQDQLEGALKRFPAAASVSAESLRDLDKELGTKTKFDADATESAQSLLAQYKLTGQQIVELTPLLQDYAARTGKDLPAAATVLGKALEGQGRGLKAVGLNFKDTGTRAGNLEELMGGLRTQVGGFAEEEGKTAVGQTAILSNEFGELEKQLGEKLLPILVGAGKGLLDLVEFVEDNERVLKPLVFTIGSVAVALYSAEKAMHAFEIATHAVELISSGFEKIVGRLGAVKEATRAAKAETLALRDAELAAGKAGVASGVESGARSLAAPAADAVAGAEAEQVLASILAGEAGKAESEGSKLTPITEGITGATTEQVTAKAAERLSEQRLADAHDVAAASGKKLAATELQVARASDGAALAEAKLATEGQLLLDLGAAVDPAAAKLAAGATAGATAGTAAKAAAGATAGSIAGRAAPAALGTASRTVGAAGGIFAGVEVNKYIGRVAVANKSTEQLTESLTELAQTGRLDANAIDLLGGGILNFGKGINTSSEALDKFGQDAEHALGGGLGNLTSNILHAGTAGAGFTERTTELDNAMSSLVQSGQIDDAAGAFTKLADAAQKDGVPLDKLEKKFPQFASALAQAAGSTDASTGAIGRNISILKAQEAAQDSKISSDIDLYAGLKNANSATSTSSQSLTENTAKLHTNTAAVIDNWQALAQDTSNLLSNRAAHRGLEQAIDDASKTIKDNGKTLDTNTAKGRANQAALDGIASSGIQAAQGLEAVGNSKGARRTLDETATALVKAGVEAGKTREQAIALAAKLLGIPNREVKLTGEISDLDSKIRDAKQHLKDRNLTDPQRTKLRGDLTDWEAKRRRLLREINGLPSRKTVTIYYQEIRNKNFAGNPATGGRASGGLIDMPRRAAGGPLPGGPMGPQLAIPTQMLTPSLPVIGAQAPLLSGGGPVVGAQAPVVGAARAAAPLIQTLATGGGIERLTERDRVTLASQRLERLQSGGHIVERDRLRTATERLERLASGGPTATGAAGPPGSSGHAEVRVLRLATGGGIDRVENRSTHSLIERAGSGGVMGIPLRDSRYQDGGRLTERLTEHLTERLALGGTVREVQRLMSQRVEGASSITSRSSSTSDQERTERVTQLVAGGLAVLPARVNARPDGKPASVARIEAATEAVRRAAGGSVPIAMVSGGEYLVSQEGTRRNRALLENINAGRAGYAVGGMVPKSLGGPRQDNVPVGPWAAGMFVVNARQTDKHAELIQAIDRGTHGFADGGKVPGGHPAGRPLAQRVELGALTLRQATPKLAGGGPAVARLVAGQRAGGTSTSTIKHDRSVTINGPVHVQAENPREFVDWARTTEAYQ